ncbi:MAG: DHH family phosphoesterase [Halodesulfurarchaeum sp.]
MAFDRGIRQLSLAIENSLLEWVQARPLQTVAIFLGALVFVIGTGYLVRRYRRPAGERFRRLLDREDSITILLHSNPDPDAMAAAMGVTHLADSVGTETSIRFPGEIRHQENRAFRTILELDLSVIESGSDLQNEAVVLVDQNEIRGLRDGLGRPPLAVIDHHPGDGTGREFTDVRPEYGACATIVAEYLETTGYTPERMDGEANGDDTHLPSDVATGLMYGIMADTNNLTTGCTAAEFQAASFLYPGVDAELLDRIANPQVDAEILEVKARAVQERTVEGPFAVSQLGPVENVDAIPQAADELLRLEGVTAVVVSGIKDDVLHLSGRSRDDRVHMGRALERAVDGIPQSSAGGHARMGGGQISLPHMEGLGPGSGVSMNEFSDRLFRSMHGEEVVEAV